MYYHWCYVTTIKIGEYILMDKNFNYSSLKLGIIGGGQLGKIMSKKAKKWDFT